MPACYFGLSQCHVNHVRPKFMPALSQECLWRASHKEASVDFIRKNAVLSSLLEIR